MTDNDQPVNALFPWEIVDCLNNVIFDKDWQSKKFVDPTWQIEKWESGLFQTPESFQKIEELCQKWGDEFIIVTDIEPIPPHQFTKIIKPAYQDFLKISSSRLAHFESHAFGSSKKWGFICDPVNDVCYLGSARD